MLQTFIIIFNVGMRFGPMQKYFLWALFALQAAIFVQFPQRVIQLYLDDDVDQISELNICGSVYHA